MAQEDDRKDDEPADVPSPAGGGPESRGPEGGKPMLKPGEFYEIEDGTSAIIITGAPGPGRAKKPERLAVPHGGRLDARRLPSPARRTPLPNR